jgi:hypothetical protein
VLRHGIVPPEPCRTAAASAYLCDGCKTHLSPVAAKVLGVSVNIPNGRIVVRQAVPGI